MQVHFAISSLTPVTLSLFFPSGGGYRHDSDFSLGQFGAYSNGKSAGSMYGLMLPPYYVLSRDIGLGNLSPIRPTITFMANTPLIDEFSTVRVIFSDGTSTVFRTFLAPIVNDTPYEIATFCVTDDQRTAVRPLNGASSETMSSTVNFTRLLYPTAGASLLGELLREGLSGIFT